MAGLGGLARESIEFHLDQADLRGSLRCSLGVVLPIAIGVSLGALGDGISAAVGALNAGFLSFQGAYRQRVGIILVASPGMAAAAVTGALAAHVLWASIVATGLWAFVAGIATVFGQRALVIGLQWAVTAVVVNAFPLSFSRALVYGGMILAGAALQAALAVASWPIRSYRAERLAITAAYRNLAALASAVQSGGSLSSSPSAVDEARRALSDPQPFGETRQRLLFETLLDEAERVGAELAAIGHLRAELAEQQGDVAPLDSLSRDAASFLRSIATALASDSAPGRPRLGERLQRDLEQISGLAARASPGVPDWLARETAAAAEALAGQLRAAARAAEESASRKRWRFSSSERADGERRRSAARRGPREEFVDLRANISWDSAAFRHALRLSGAVAAAMVVFRLSGLAHGYWIALTALLVLRQDYRSTAVRGLSRVGGTVAGAGLSTLLIAGLEPPAAWLIVLLGLASFAAYLLVRVNYALFSVFVTTYVVVLLSFVALPALATAADRVAATVIGGGLAVGVYLAWPTWESGMIAGQLASLVRAQADYGEAVLNCFAEPSSDLRQRLGQLRSTARLARSNAELSLIRLLEEPARARRASPLSAERLTGLAAAARRLSLGILTLHARLPGENVPPLPPLGTFAAALGGGMRLLADRLCDLGEDSSASASYEEAEESLRRCHNELVARLAGESRRDDVALVLAETDELTDALNSASHLLGQLREPGAPRPTSGRPTPEGRRLPACS